MNRLPINRIDLAKQINGFRANPPFGGTAPTPPATDPATTPPAAPGGATPPPAVDPIAQLQSDPNALAQLLTQVQTLTQSTSQLQQQLGLVTTERDSYLQKEKDAELAQKSKEEQLETQINELKAAQEKRDNIIRQKIVENAIAANNKYEWQNSRLVQGELDQTKLEFNVDIDKGIAEIKGIDAELERIASAHTYLVSKNKAEPPADPTQQQQPQAPRRSTGAPPRPPAAPEDKDAKRKRAMKAFPSLSAASGPPMA